MPPAPEAVPVIVGSALVRPDRRVRVEAGPRRVEPVPNGTRVNIHITSDDDSALATETMTGTAILLLGGKPVRTSLVPATAGVLSGNTGVTVPEGVKAAVQLTEAEGKTAQANY